MLSKITDQVISSYLRKRWSRIVGMKNEPGLLQSQILRRLMVHNQKTVYGRRHGFNRVKSLSDYKNQLPVVHYEDIKSLVDQMMMGASDVLVPGFVKWYAKSSGTTSARSKYIPVTNQYFHGNILRSCWDVTSIIQKHRPDAALFKEKSLIMGGALSPFKANPEVIIGDISAIMIKRLPWIGRPFYTPDIQTALLSDWEEKIEKMAQKCMDENVVMFGGVPTWNIVLFDRLLEMTGKQKISEVWPQVHTYLHGGVGFNPYRAQFESYIGKTDFDFYEVYNASEGYFSVQDDSKMEGMLLLTDNGIFYEFIPKEEIGSKNPITITLEEVEIGVDYAIVISNFAGLYRYAPGDTVRFTSTKPYRIQVSGRTKHYINVFGEEVMVGNTDSALAITCRQLEAIVRDYTVAPIPLLSRQKGGHQWLIEFDKQPNDLPTFAAKLDENLRRLNSDYDAKRQKDLALEMLKIKRVPSGTFHRWLKSKGKIGGQHKVPRLSNNRNLLEEILSMI